MKTFWYYAQCVLGLLSFFVVPVVVIGGFVTLAGPVVVWLQATPLGHFVEVVIVLVFGLAALFVFVMAVVTTIARSFRRLGHGDWDGGPGDNV